MTITLKRLHVKDSTARSVYMVIADGIYLGTITSWETYIWSIDSKYCPGIMSDYRTRTGAIQRLLDDYNNL